MSSGREKCELMKKIRDEIALLNDIECHSEECNSTEDCQGHCPQCDAEIKQLDAAINQKIRNGEPVSVSSIVDWIVDGFEDRDFENQWDNDVAVIRGSQTVLDVWE